MGLILWCFTKFSFVSCILFNSYMKLLQKVIQQFGVRTPTLSSAVSPFYQIQMSQHILLKRGLKPVMDRMGTNKLSPNPNQRKMMTGNTLWTG